MTQNDQKRPKNENFGQNFFSQKCPKWFKFTQKFTRITLKWTAKMKILNLHQG